MITAQEWLRAICLMAMLGWFPLAGTVYAQDAMDNEIAENDVMTPGDGVATPDANPGEVIEGRDLQDDSEMTPDVDAPTDMRDDDVSGSDSEDDMLPGDGDMDEDDSGLNGDMDGEMTPGEEEDSE